MGTNPECVNDVRDTFQIWMPRRTKRGPREGYRKKGSEGNDTSVQRSYLWWAILSSCGHFTLSLQRKWSKCFNGSSCNQIREQIPLYRQKLTSIYINRGKVSGFKSPLVTFYLSIYLESLSLSSLFLKFKRLSRLDSIVLFIKFTNIDEH